MRIFGIVLLIVGTILEVLLLLARLGGGDVSLIAFGVVAMLILTGWRMRTYGKPIGQPLPASARGTAAKHVPSPELQSLTIELPLTPAVSAAIASAKARSRRIMSIIILSGTSFFLLLGGAVGFALSSFIVFALLAMIGLVVGLIVAGIFILTGYRPMQRDLRDSTYLQTRGPVQLVTIFGGSMLRLADCAFFVEPAVVKALKGLTWATIDYSRHAHVVFEVRDHSGCSVYSLEVTRDRKPAYLRGGLYSIRCGEHFEIFKVLAVFKDTIHVRIFPEHFKERPKSVPPTLGELDGPYVDRGARHLALSKFASWQPELLAHGEVSNEELEGYDLDGELAC